MNSILAYDLLPAAFPEYGVHYAGNGANLLI